MDEYDYEIDAESLVIAVGAVAAIAAVFYGVRKHRRIKRFQRIEANYRDHMEELEIAERAAEKKLRQGQPPEDVNVWLHHEFERLNKKYGIK